MTVRFGAILLSALLVGALTAPSFAETVKRKHRGHFPAPVEQKSNWKGLSEDFFAGAPEDPGSNNRYFTDTRQPDNRTLGAPIFERWQ